MVVFIPRRSPSFAVAVMVTAALAFGAMADPAAAQRVSREQDISELRLGQKVLVDDGTCPNGQIKEITGATLTATGVARTRKCIPRSPR
jgi:hypothetical protein